VVIATRDRPARLAACLESLAAQDYPRERFEVIVVEDGGDCGLHQMGARYRERLQLRTLTRPYRGRSAARNHGAADAGGELVAFTDDDTEPEPGWLRALATRHAALPGDALGGRTVTMSDTNPYARVGGLILDLAYSHRSSHLPAGARFFAANNLALPADRFRMLGGFNPRLDISEDRELCDRWAEHGFGMTFVPEAVIRHATPTSLRGFCRKHFGYGRGAFAYQRARWHRGLGLSGFDSSFYRGPVRQAAREIAAQRDSLSLALLVAWQALTAAGFAWEAMLGARHGSRRP
jgi:cellulose synthase/poly-beta-1,6-N-acetylglucosamine synthase-like glycosyltransferase